jgi:hypothetical protein
MTAVPFLIEVLDLAWQRPSAAYGHHQPVLYERGQRAVALRHILPCRSQVVIFNRVVSGPQQSEQSTTALSIGSLIRLDSSTRVKLSWMARPLPGTKILYGAGMTCRIASPAYQRTKLH